MHSNKKKIEMLFRAINRTSTEAITQEELIEELRSSGVDADQLVKRVRSRLDTAMDLTKEGRRFSLPLIRQLRRLTNLSSTDIAHRLN
ncbi:MAG TPA: hypothetical protein VN843_03235, partial [Anaerolineales bacterium]|nr:hypothetical protein [Anaerolineales bacterium]